jgi:predicted flap endonuclease-1-like 5' DNA nuclease
MTTSSWGIRLVSCSVLLGLPLLASCGLLGKKGGDAADAEAEAAVAEVAEAAAPVAATPAAANENDVSRFPDEKKLENVAATIQRPTNVREIPGIGKVVASLAKGGTVTEIAQRSTFFLVVFENPADKKQLMGWISQDSFTAPAAVVAKPPVCTVPETAIISDNVALCGKICATDGDCQAGQACKGRANKFAAGKIGNIGEPVDVCTVFTPVAARPAPVPIPVTPVATPAVIPPPAGIIGDPVGGKCATGFVLVAKDNKCHRACTKIGQCVPNGFCVPCAGGLVCGATKEFCK